MVFAAAVAAQPATPVELFQKAKEEYRLGQHRASLADLDRLEEAAEASGDATVRKQITPAVAFYRGANWALLGDQARAVRHFSEYLRLEPRATIDPAAYPSRVLEAFRKAREAAPGKEPGAAEATGLAAAYESFRPNPAARAEPLERWADGPVYFLLTSRQLQEWKDLASDGDRAAFISNFWADLDPTPHTPENEFRQEFNRRVAFADSRFTVGEKRGALTDRGMVFLLLGAPSYARRKPLTLTDDPSVADRVTAHSLQAPNAPGFSGGTAPRSPGANDYMPPISDSIRGVRETWHYYRDRLPEAMRFKELDFDFVTKEGIGSFVLQRNDQVLLALDSAKRHLALGKE
jgi:GWxTD domain-containing protein